MMTTLNTQNTLRAYIVLQTGRNREIVDQFDYQTKEQQEEAKRMLGEYQMLSGGTYTLVRRPTKLLLDRWGK